MKYSYFNKKVFGVFGIWGHRPTNNIAA